MVRETGEGTYNRDNVVSLELPQVQLEPFWAEPLLVDESFI